MIPKIYRPIMVTMLIFLCISDFYNERYILGNITLIAIIALIGIYTYQFAKEKKEKEIDGK